MAKVKTQEPEHALLSASGAHRWLTCTPSARLEETLPDSKSEYAAEGSLAHQIGELKLRKAFVEPMGPRTFNNRIKKFKENPLYQDEMLKHTDTYLDYISGIVHGFNTQPYIAVEKRLDYGSYAPEGFGTGDCIIICANNLHVIDFKYGKGVPVSAYKNPQMLLYALGAYTEYSFLYAIDTVKVAIIQPRIDGVPSEYELPVADLLAWGESIKPIAQKAFAGEGEFVPGEHCKFCRAKALCRARADFNTSLEEYGKMLPPLISNEEVGQILGRAQNLAAWVKALEDYALNECLAGNVIPGWKAVHGTSKRGFTDTDAAFKVLTGAGYEETLLYNREPLTLAKVEELLGKPKFNELLTAYVIKPPGKPTLVPESDKREAITLQITPEQAFGENNGNGGNENGYSATN
ncbi:MAG: DUF2800 domain-containing protein [Bacillota bacterium]